MASCVCFLVAISDTWQVNLGAGGETRAMIAAATVDRFFHSENIALLVEQNSYQPVDVLVRSVRHCTSPKALGHQSYSRIAFMVEA